MQKNFKKKDELDCFLGRHVSAWVEGVGGRLAVDPKGRFQSHRQLGDGADFQANGARPFVVVAAVDGRAVATAAAASGFAPVVPALDVAALEVDVGRLVGRRQRRLPRQHQRVQTDRTLRLARVQLVHRLL